MHDKSIKLSIITVAYKSNAVIKRCINSIKKYNDIADAIEIVVIDNFPFGDDAFSSIASEYPDVTVINNPSNGGFGQGNNIGVKNSTGEYLLFLNPDIELIEPIFSFAVDKFECKQKLAAFGMTLCNEEGQACKQSYGFLPEDSGRVKQILFNCLIKFFNITPKGIYPWGADIFIRRSVFEGIGGFDEKYFLCYEEPDLIRRIPAHFKVQIFKNKIIHSGGHSLKVEEPIKVMNWFFKSEQYYFDKYKLDYRKFARQMLLKLRVRMILKLALRREIKLNENAFLDHYKNIVDSH
jgi:GT2 family glycosyltransferase